MKHPALARVFAVVLAILGMLLLLWGLKGFGKNDAERTEREAYAEKLSGRIENYIQLSGQLDRSADYKETMEALDTVLTAHEKYASQHKTDTAIHSATKGGIKMGENMILAARAEIEDMRRQLKDATSRRAFLQGMISQLLAAERDRLPCLDAVSHSAAEYAVEAWMDSAELAVAANELRALDAMEPTPSGVAAAMQGPPQAPAMPDLPQIPNLNGASYEEVQAAWQAAAADYQSAAAAYGQANTQYAQQMQQYYNLRMQSEMERLYGVQESAKGGAADAVYSAEYQREHARWEKECRELKSGVDLLHYSAEIRKLSAALANIVSRANLATFFLMPETGGIFPGLYELTLVADSVADRLQRQGTNPAALSNKEFLQLADEAKDTLDQLWNAFSIVAMRIYDPSDLVLDLMDKLKLTDTLVKYLDYMLERSEREMQAALEELWYQLGEEEKKQLTLEAEKLELDEEAIVLAKDMVEADELKDLRNRCNTARQLLLNLPGVKDASETDGDLAGSAQRYLDTYRQETERIYNGKRLINLLAVVGGVMGLLAVLPSYELVKKRFLLLAPVLLCLCCAATAEGLSLTLGFGQQYIALFTGIFALIQLLIVLPRAKKPIRTPQHLL